MLLRRRSRQSHIRPLWASDLAWATTPPGEEAAPSQGLAGKSGGPPRVAPVRVRRVAPVRVAWSELPDSASDSVSGRPGRPAATRNARCGRGASCLANATRMAGRGCSFRDIVAKSAHRPAEGWMPLVASSDPTPTPGGDLRGSALDCAAWDAKQSGLKNLSTTRTSTPGHRAASAGRARHHQRSAAKARGEGRRATLQGRG